MGLDHDLEVQAGPSRRFGPLSSSDEWAGHIPMSASELTPRASGDPRAGPIEEIEAKPLLGWRERIRHFTWTWYTLVMATGGIANVIYACTSIFQSATESDVLRDYYRSPSIPGEVFNRRDFHDLEHRNLPVDQCGHVTPFLPLAQHFQGFFSTSNRITVCSCTSHKRLCDTDHRCSICTFGASHWALACHDDGDTLLDIYCLCFSSICCHLSDYVRVTSTFEKGQ